LPELVFVTEIAEGILTLPGALCYFNPNGECLHPAESVSGLLARHKGPGPAAQELWSNVRIYDVTEDPSWCLMDTVGMWQLDVPDHEACFAKSRYDPSEVSLFLRNAADYVCQRGPVIRDGGTMDGPGGIRLAGRRLRQRPRGSAPPGPALAAHGRPAAAPRHPGRVRAPAIVSAAG
jgi:hypothetical protein